MQKSFRYSKIKCGYADFIFRNKKISNIIDKKYATL